MTTGVWGCDPSLVLLALSKGEQVMEMPVSWAGGSLSHGGTHGGWMQRVDRGSYSLPGTGRSRQAAHLAHCWPSVPLMSPKRALVSQAEPPPEGSAAEGAMSIAPGSAPAHRAL